MRLENIFALLITEDSLIYETKIEFEDITVTFILNNLLTTLSQLRVESNVHNEKLKYYH